MQDTKRQSRSASSGWAHAHPTRALYQSRGRKRPHFFFFPNFFSPLGPLSIGASGEQGEPGKDEFEERSTAASAYGRRREVLFEALRRPSSGTQSQSNE